MQRRSVVSAVFVVFVLVNFDVVAFILIVFDVVVFVVIIDAFLVVVVDFVIVVVVLVAVRKAKCFLKVVDIARCSRTAGSLT
jgi:hypothetical protein